MNAAPATPEAYVLKLRYDNNATKPRWVLASGRRSLVPREKATVFPNRAAADAEALIWTAVAITPFSIVVEPA